MNFKTTTWKYSTSIVHELRLIGCMLYSNGLMFSGPYQKVLWSVSTPSFNWVTSVGTWWRVTASGIKGGTINLRIRNDDAQRQQQEWHVFFLFILSSSLSENLYLSSHIFGFSDSNVLVHGKGVFFSLDRVEENLGRIFIITFSMILHKNIEKRGNSDGALRWIFLMQNPPLSSPFPYLLVLFGEM